MLYSYRLATETVTDAQDKSVRVFGISVHNENGEIVEAFPDLFFDISRAEELVNLCNTEQPDISHLQYIIEDIFV